MLNILRIPVRRQQLMLAFVDIVILSLSLPIAVLVRNTGMPEGLSTESYLNIPLVVLDFVRYYTGATTIGLVVFLSLYFVFDLYNPDRRIAGFRGFLYVAFVCGLAVVIIPVFYYFAPHWKVGRGLLAIQAGFVAVATFAARAVYSRFHEKFAKPRRLLVVGAGRTAVALLEEIHTDFRNEIEVVGVLDDDPAKLEFELNGYRVIGGTRDIARLVREKGVEIIVFAIPRQNHPVDQEIMREILGLKATGIEVYQMPTFFKKITGRIPIDFVEESWLIFGQGMIADAGGASTRFRRLLDIALAAGALILLSPVFALIAIAIKLTSRGPVLYRQERLGLNRRPYRMIKFRTMVTDAERDRGPTWSQGRKDARVTRVGRILRRTRMDEIPNFINVLLGEMSVVGPRPERAHFVEVLEKQIPYYGLRFVVKPGLTGWAQVNYSYGASLEDARRKLQYEMFYIQERSLFLDCLILLKTAQTVILRPGS
jgi:exopolysaccharide biosynthesis polyprenyl glycosylphosphotransferase